MRRRGDLSIHRIEFIHSATGQLHFGAGCSAASERPTVIGFEAPFDDDDVFPEHHVLHDVTVSRKAGDKGANKLVSEGRLSIEDHARNFQRHGFRVEGQNPVLIVPCHALKYSSMNARTSFAEASAVEAATAPLPPAHLSSTAAQRRSRDGCRFSRGCTMRRAKQFCLSGYLHVRPTPIVFVVDDDVSVRESLELLIRYEGWQAEIFASADEFLSRPRPRCPKLPDSRFISAGSQRSRFAKADREPNGPICRSSSSPATATSPRLSRR